MSRESLAKAYREKHIDSRISTLMQTSGSTASPKLACHTFENYLSSAEQSTKALKLTTTSRSLITLPLYHVAGLTALFRALYSGGMAIFPENSHLQKYAPTHASMVPAQVELFEKIQTPMQLLVGGSAIPETLHTRLKHHRVLTSYGMTETTAMIFCNGIPLPGVTPFIGEENSLWIKSASLFSGYYNGREILPPPLVNGFYPTNDIAEVNENGAYTILGRKDGVFISGGENISPREIETHLMAHPSILRAIVKPIPHPVWGCVPVAYISPGLPQVDVKKFLEKTLPKYKIPHKISPIEELGWKYTINF